MRGIALVVAALVAATAVRAAELPSGISLRGKWTQGAVLFGKAPVGTRVWVGGRELKLTPGGNFVFGLDRDAPRDAVLRVQMAGQADPRDYHYAVEQRQYKIQHIDNLPEKMVTPPKDVIDRIIADANEVKAVRQIETDGTGFLQPFIWPARGRISGVFGSQRILNGQPKQPHYGVDVAVPVGTKVHAPADGVVVLAEPNLYYTGGTLMVDHGYGLQSAFLHLSKLLVKKGQHVKQGDVIALSGMSGRATGPHLDWRVNWFDERVDAQMLVPPMSSATPIQH
ncbi:M23 family metallopeptidase [Solimonas sp. C16B3]|uniref:M23 family metallopeptidase n=1 Tax=Solimonas marina TaxID=2714601 RepID=A0A969WAF4_9GAMM|nr:M23 family metallopeptidase [Solimonas marina]